MSKTDTAADAVICLSAVADASPVQHFLVPVCGGAVLPLLAVLLIALIAAGRKKLRKLQAGVGSRSTGTY